MQLDSLKTLLDKETIDSNKVSLFIQMGHESLSNNNEQPLSYAQQAYELSKKIGYKKGIVNSYLLYASVYNRSGNFSDANVYSQRALAIAKEIKYPLAVAQSYLLIANSKRSIEGNTNEVIQYYLDAAELYKQLNSQYESACYFNIGLVYQEQKKYDKAIEYASQALKLNEKFNRVFGKLKCWTLMGEVYKDEGIYKLAMECYNQTLKLATQTNNNESAAEAFLGIGSVYRMQKDFDKAIRYVNQAMTSAGSIDSKLMKTWVLMEFGRIYSDQNKLDSAKANLNAALKLAQEIMSKEDIIKTYDLLAEVYSKQKNYEQAYKCQQLAKSVNDSLLDGKKIVIAEEKTNSVKQSSNYWKYTLIAVIILLSGIFLFFFVRRKEK